MNIFKIIKYRYLEWHWDQVLERSGHPSWQSYLRWNDPDFNIGANTMRDQFHGYPYVAVVPFKYLEFEVDPMWGEVYHGKQVVNWCSNNCRRKYRWQWERVIMDYYGHYVPNGIGGTDEFFIGFKDERDYFMFILRWS